MAGVRILKSNYDSQRDAVQYSIDQVRLTFGPSLILVRFAG